MLAAIVDGEAVPGAVRGEIDASWRRSSAFGLDPDRFDVPFDADLDGETALGRAAGPVLDQLLVDTGDAGVAFVLTDPAGHVLGRRVADGRLNAQLDEVLLAPGFVYAEDAVGTNGIGTALAERRPTVVAGGEHFAGSLTTFACAAAPVFDPTTRRLVGAVDLTCLAPNASSLMLPFARRAAQEIEQRLVDAAGLADRFVLQHYLEQRKRIKGPYVVVTERRMLP
ncbi:MAG: modulated sigma54 specific transcriptional regulator, Fis family, partial [Actinomycetia bacterium]|nr:modulated sigma54 specific transcriptional regulator, Fis family [Actinomycetes bacterium]